MDLEFYDKDRHEYFLDQFKQYSREASEEEKEFFEEFLEETVEDIAEVTGISADFKLYYAMTDEDSLDNDLPINRYVHGFSFAEWMNGFDRDVIMIRAVKDRENWRDCLVNMLAHEMAHQEFYSITHSAPYTNLENIVFEGHAMNRAEQVAEELNVGWKPHYRSSKVPDIDVETVIDVLEYDRSYESENIFQNGEKPCSEAEGYQISYLVVKDILEYEELTLEDIPSQSELATQVRKSLKTVLSK